MVCDNDGWCVTMKGGVWCDDERCPVGALIGRVVLTMTGGV